jgi:hypothetical protein
VLPIKALKEFVQPEMVHNVLYNYALINQLFYVYQSSVFQSIVNRLNSHNIRENAYSIAVRLLGKSMNWN